MNGTQKKKIIDLLFKLPAVEESCKLSSTVINVINSVYNAVCRKKKYLYSFSSLVDGNFKCGVSQEYPDQYECIPLLKCERDITRHLEMYGFSEDPSLVGK